jgi:transglutaminase/protease-like cytokinesis protein 3
MQIKYFSLLIMLFLLPMVFWAQIKPEVKETVDTYQNEIDKVGLLAARINKDFNNDLDKVGAIYYWIANNIKFDIKNYYSKRKKYSYHFRYKTQEEKVRKIEKADNKVTTSIFSKRYGSAKGFACLFKKLCNNAGISCEVVPGTYKSSFKYIGRKPGVVNHYWNAVKINGKWYLVDVVHGAGSVNEKSKKFESAYNENWFLASPENFFLNHYPAKTEWLFIEKTKEDFALQPLFYSGYISSELRLVAPVLGEITSVLDNKLRIALREEKNIEPTGFSYSFFNGEDSGKITPFVQDEQVWLEVPLDGRRYDYLTIYYCEQPFLSYKIKLSQ